MSGPIKHNTTGLWVGKKTAQGREEKRTYHAYSCGWKVQWLLSLRIVSSGKTVCVVRDSWKKKSFNSFLSLTMSKRQCRRSTMAKALCAHKWLPKPQLQLFFLLFSSSANSGRKVFSVKWCSAEWQTNRAISPLARAHFSILDIASVYSLPNISRMDPPDTSLCQLDWKWGSAETQWNPSSSSSSSCHLSPEMLREEIKLEGRKIKRK